MSKEQNKTRKKIDYVKPEILDLGPVTAGIGGADCTSGGTASGNCGTGMAANGNCTDGSTVGSGICILGTGGNPG
jgi:hypothetical protein